MSEEIYTLLRQIRQLVACHPGLGLDAYPLTPGLAQWLQPKTQKPAAGAARPASPTAPPAAPAVVPLALAPDGATLADLQDELGECRRCGLHAGRQRIVFGEGHEKAKLLIVGDCPGPEEDRLGVPFTGAEGELLARMLQAIGLCRAEAYLACLVKCLPPEGRAPQPHEIRTCLPFLLRQIGIVAPQAICVMGEAAARVMLETGERLFRLRGRLHDFHGIPLVVTYHPALLLRSPELKKAAWIDLQLVMRQFGGSGRP